MVSSLLLKGCDISTDTFRVEDVKLPMAHPKKAFMMGSLEKEIRLSFAARIRGTLPEPYRALISEAKEQDTPDFKYSDESELESMTTYVQHLTQSRYSLFRPKP